MTKTFIFKEAKKKALDETLSKIKNLSSYSEELKNIVKLSAEMAIDEYVDAYVNLLTTPLKDIKKVATSNEEDERLIDEP